MYLSDTNLRESEAALASDSTANSPDGYSLRACLAPLFLLYPIQCKIIVIGTRPNKEQEQRTKREIAMRDGYYTTTFTYQDDYARQRDWW